MIENISYL